MKPSNTLSPRARLGLGLALIACGIFPILAAFDAGGPFRQADINGPPWLAGVAGGIFVVAGLTMMRPPQDELHPLSFLLFFILLSGFAAMGNWIAFGAGPRVCGVSVSGFFFTASNDSTELTCRAAFGIGAIIMNGFLFYLLASAPKKYLGDTPITRTLDKLGSGVLLVALAPILIPLLLFGLMSGLWQSFRDYLRTGSWPRNEAFIARMKKRREKSRNDTPDN